MRGTWPGASPFVVGADAVCPEVLLHRRRRSVGLGRLEAAVQGRDHLVAPGPVEPCPPLGAHRKLGLVPIAVRLRRAQDLLHRKVLFVHGAVRGERCALRILKVLKTTAYARVEAILTPAAGRLSMGASRRSTGGRRIKHLPPLS